MIGVFLFFHTVIYVLGGFDGFDRTGVVDPIRMSPFGDSQPCSPVPPLPVPNTFVTALTDAAGRPMACGGGADENCVVFDPELYSWVDFPESLLEERYHPATVRLTDGRYWIIGGDNGVG